MFRRDVFFAALRVEKSKSERKGPSGIFESSTVEEEDEEWSKRPVKGIVFAGTHQLRLRPCCSVRIIQQKRGKGDF